MVMADDAWETDWKAQAKYMVSSPFALETLGRCIAIHSTRRVDNKCSSIGLLIRHKELKIRFV